MKKKSADGVRLETEDEEQRYGRNKDTIINRTYINSGDYRKKFDKISASPKLNRLLYQLSKKMLEHRSGTEYEDMYWIDPQSIAVIAEETESDFVLLFVMMGKYMYIHQNRQLMKIIII